MPKKVAPRDEHIFLKNKNHPLFKTNLNPKSKEKKLIDAQNYFLVDPKAEEYILNKFGISKKELKEAFAKSKEIREKMLQKVGNPTYLDLRKDFDSLNARDKMQFLIKVYSKYDHNKWLQVKNMLNAKEQNVYYKILGDFFLKNHNYVLLNKMAELLETDIRHYLLVFLKGYLYKHPEYDADTFLKSIVKLNNEDIAKKLEELYKGE